jgi:flagellar biosynthesis/type III secretory pathway M-ring protein FliF/YscJ
MESIMSADWAIAWATILTVIVIVVGMVLEARRRGHEKAEEAARAKRIEDDEEEERNQAEADKRHSELIADLFRKIQLLENAINDFRLEVAKEYHPKSEIKEILDNLSKTINCRFDQLERLINLRAVEK